MKVIVAVVSTLSFALITNALPNLYSNDVELPSSAGQVKRDADVPKMIMSGTASMVQDRSDTLLARAEKRHQADEAQAKQAKEARRDAVAKVQIASRHEERNVDTVLVRRGGLPRMSLWEAKACLLCSRVGCSSGGVSRRVKTENGKDQLQTGLQDHVRATAGRGPRRADGILYLSVACGRSAGLATVDASHTAAQSPQTFFSKASTMGPASLETLPDELFEQVVQRLNLNDIGNVRLVNRSTASKAAQDTYRSFFRKKHVDLTRQSLESFVKVTSHGGVACQVEDLTLVGIVYNPKDLQTSIGSGIKLEKPRMGSSRFRVDEPYRAMELEAAKKDLAMLKRRRKEDEALREGGDDVVLLSKAFSNIARSTRSKGLRLSLDIKIHRGDTVPKSRHWLWPMERPIFEAAAHVFLPTMEALHSSQLRLQTLDIFYAWVEQSKCSLSCNNLAKLEFASGRLSACLSALNVLRVSITDELIDNIAYSTQEFSEEDQAVVSEHARSTPDIALSRDKITNEKNYSALSEMLELCPNLEELEIVGHRLDCSNEELKGLQETMRSRYVHYLARMTPLLRLRKLCLTGLEMLDDDLLEFLRHHKSSLRKLELSEVTIPAGSFSTIESYVLGTDIELEAIRFQDVREPRELIHFAREGEGLHDNDIVRRWGLEQKRDISYLRFSSGRLGYPTTWVWTLKQLSQEEIDEDMGPVFMQEW